MKKQIHRFLRAARADVTALSVYCNLETVRKMPFVQGLKSLPGLCVLLHSSSLCLDNIDGLVLLLNQDAHLD